MRGGSRNKDRGRGGGIESEAGRKNKREKRREGRSGRWVREGEVRRSSRRRGKKEKIHE